MLKSVCYASLLQQSVQQQIVLSIRSLFSFSTMICTAADSVVYQVTLLPSNNSLHHSEQYCVLGCCAPFLHWQFALLCIRLLCSLSTLVICTVVHQVTLLPSYISNLHCCTLGHFASFLQ